MDRDTIIIVIVILSIVVAFVFGFSIGMAQFRKYIFGLMRKYPTMFVEEWLSYFDHKKNRRTI